MTTQGPGPALDPRQPLEAARFCEMRGNLRLMAREADDHNPSYSTWLGMACQNDWAAYRYLAFTGSEKPAPSAPPPSPGLRPE